MSAAMPTTSIGKSIGRIERREWFLWSAAVTVTLLLTLGLASFLLREDDPLSDFPQSVRGLIGLVLIFDIYTLFQQMQIHRMRRRLIRGEELFRLISENAADMIAVVDMEGKRIFNSFSYERVLGYSLEELGKSSSFEQIHPEDRDKVRQAAEEARRTGVGTLAEVLGGMEDQLKTLGMGAWLHDIGKLAIPDSVLLKPGALNEQERQIMQRHVDLGYDLVKGIPFLTNAAEVILAHHERRNGSGYPRGLRGEDVPMCARIFAVADSFDAMTSDRPYRSALPLQTAQNLTEYKSTRLEWPAVGPSRKSMALPRASRVAEWLCSRSVIATCNC
jgi:hypothetical protein